MNLSLDIVRADPRWAKVLSLELFASAFLSAVYSVLLTRNEVYPPAIVYALAAAVAVTLGYRLLRKARSPIALVLFWLIGILIWKLADGVPLLGVTELPPLLSVLLLSLIRGSADGESLAGGQSKGETR